MGISPTTGIVVYIVLCAFIVYTFILNDASTSTLSHCVTITIPNKLTSLLRKLLGDKTMRRLESMSDYFLTIVYLVIVLGCWSIMFTFGYTFIRNSSYVSSYHQYSGGFVFVLCMWSWRKASDTSPGFVHAGNILRFDNYPYDDFLFVKGKICPTVGIPKLARSKYDTCTNKHVARFDHYCGWVRNAVGEENYRYFLFFLFVHVNMCAYGTYVTYNLFRGEVKEKDLMNAIFYNGKTGHEVQADVWVVFHYILMKHFELSAVLLLMAVMALVLCMFLSFHLYIAANGMTTNEFFKWRQIKKWHRIELSRYEKALKDGTINSDDGHGDGKNENQRKQTQRQLQDVDVGCVGPVGPVGNTSQTSEDANTDTDNPTTTQEEDEKMPTISDPGPFPKNIYNQGIVENFKEIIFPRSLRTDALIRIAEARRNGQIPNSKSIKATPAKSSTKTKDT